MKRKTILAAFAAILAVSMTACGGVPRDAAKVTASSFSSNKNTEQSLSETSAVEDVSVIITDPLFEPIGDSNPGFAVTYYLDDEEKIAVLKDSSVGINTMNVAMINAVCADSPDSNSEMLSGFSAYSCIAAAEKYTENSTKDQIKNALGVMTPDALDYFKNNMPIDTGTMFLIDDGTKLNAEMTDDFVRDNLQSDGIVDVVNNYVAEKTHNLIPSVISSSFSEDTRAVVLDTLYFKGTWRHKFDKDFTEKKIFHGENGDTETDFMRTSYKFGVNTDNKIIQLPYENTSLVMDICYDIGDKSPADAFAGYVSKSAEFEPDYSYDVNLAMPKFEAESDVSLKKTCESLGMTNMFDPSFSSDFKSLADDICVSDIIQKTKIIVDEEGTEAAAVTMMTMNTTSAMPEEQKTLDITIDKPFVYAIRDTETNIILFAGYVKGFDIP